MTHYAERAAESNAAVRRPDRTKRTGTAAVLGGLLLLASLAADTLLSDATVRDPTHAAYYLAVGGLFVGSTLLLSSLPDAYRRRLGAGWFGRVGVALSGAGFGLMATGSAAQGALAALGRTAVAEVAGFVFAAGLLVGVVASLPLGVAALRGPGGPAARLYGVLLLASAPGLIVSLAAAETNVALAAIAFGAYPLAWVVLGHSLRTDAARRNRGDAVR